MRGSLHTIVTPDAVSTKSGMALASDDVEISSLILRDANGCPTGFETDPCYMYNLLKVAGSSATCSGVEVKAEPDTEEEGLLEAESDLKAEPAPDFKKWELATTCTGERRNCFLPRTAFKTPDGNLVLVENLLEGCQVLAADGAPLLVQSMHCLERQKCHIVELVTRLGSFTASACHRVVVSADGQEKSAAELSVGDQVFMGKRELRLTKVTHLQKWTELFSISFDRDQAVECFIVPMVGMQTLGERSAIALINTFGLSQYSENDLLQAMPAIYEE